MERVFEIGRVYRNEGLSPRHNPEFTMFEAYQAYGDYHSMMDLTESLICGAIEAIGGGFVRPWGEATLDFTMEKWGLGYEDLSAINPRLVMLRTTGFGQNGPYSTRPGFGTLAESMSGFAYMTGQPDGPPTLPPFGLADGIAGIAGALATMFALYNRDARGGQGQMIDLAIMEPS